MLSPLKKRDIFNFSIGDLGINLNFQLIRMWLMYVYTDVFGISLLHVGGIFLFARLWDALNDPMMGILADRTRNKTGTYKPFIYWGAIPLNLILIACFSMPELSDTMKVVYCYFAYILHGMVFTAVGTSYSAMGTLVTQDQQERAKISTMRMCFAVVVACTIIGSYVKPFATGVPIVFEFIGKELYTWQGPSFKDEAQGWFYTAIIFGVISTVILFYTALTTKERVSEPVKKYDLKDLKKILFKNDALMILSLSMFFNTAIWVIQLAAAPYYFKYVADESLQTMFFQWMLPANIIGVVLTPILTAKFGKKNIFILGSLIVFFANVGRHFIPIPTTDVYNLFIGLSMVGSTSMMFCSICQWGMVPDTIEYGHWKTGIRAEGLPLTFFTFMQKSAMAFGAGVVALVLWATGFVANTELQGSALSGIKVLFNICPGLFSLTCLIALLYYKLGKEKYDQVLADLKVRSQDEPGS